jgi:prepilin-type N-terminal cleavage/methylation domain-containing protein
MKKYFKINSGFTLIELLVVVSIIGLLSSIVLVSLKSSSNNARIAAGMQFSANIKNGLGDELKGEWRFEDNINDSSGYGNNCSGTSTYVSSASPNLGKAISFPGTSSLSCGNNPSIDITGGAITIEAWVNKTVVASGYILSKTDGTNRQYSLHWNFSRVYFSIYSGGNTCSMLTSGFNSVPVGVWKHLAVTFNNGTATYYVDGKQTMSFTSPSCISIGTLAGSSLYIGSNATTSYFNGLVDDVRIYARTLKEAEIQQHYVEGAAKHGLVIGK